MTFEIGTRVRVESEAYDIVGFHGTVTGIDPTDPALYYVSVQGVENGLPIPFYEDELSALA